jgi:hypothetical protein
MKVHGSSSITARVNQMGIENCFDIYVGQDHVPEVSNAQFYDTTKVIMRNFLAHFVCGNTLNCSYTGAVGMENIPGNNDEVLVYPNPVQNEFAVWSSELGDGIVELYDSFGKKIFSRQQTINNKQQTFNVSDLPNGIYFLQLKSRERFITQKIAIQH